MLGLLQKKDKETFTVSPTKETAKTFWIQDLMELKSMHSSDPVCTCNLPSLECFKDSAKLPSWSAGKVWTDWFRCFKFITGRSPHPPAPPIFFPTRKRLINSPSKCFRVSTMAPVFKILWTSFCTKILPSWLDLGEFGMFFCWKISWNGIA